MGPPRVALTGVDVQILGHWNPSLFVPRWFSDVGLLPDEEAESARIEVIHEEIAAFAVDWLSLSVQRDRLIALTTRLSHSEALRDLVVGTLELLTHTPTRAVGINYNYLLQFEDRKSFDRFGWTIVEPKHWPLLERPGMATVQVQGMRSDNHQGYIRVKAEPILDDSYRVVVGVNDHYELSPEGSSKSTPALASILQAQWRESGNRAEGIVEDMKKLGL